VAGGNSERRSADGSAQGDPGAARELLLAATARAISEHGVAGLEVERIASYANVPSATFYDHFADEEQALLGASEAFFDRLSSEVSDACDGIDEWPLRVRAALAAIISYLVDASGLARVLALEAAGLSLAATERQFAAFDRFAAQLRVGRRLYPRSASLPPPTERTLVGGVASVLSAHLLAEEVDALAALEPDLVELVLTPFLGQREARRVARS
jgi:AcrR family transcriptional regulator